jgi:hypothetical protein
VLVNRCLWATHYSQLNDAREFVEGEELIRRIGYDPNLAKASASPFRG